VERFSTSHGEQKAMSHSYSKTDDESEEARELNLAPEDVKYAEKK
jgi:hypothetical protein